MIYPNMLYGSTQSTCVLRVVRLCRCGDITGFACQLSLLVCVSVCVFLWHPTAGRLFNTILPPTVNLLPSRYVFNRRYVSNRSKYLRVFIRAWPRSEALSRITPSASP